MRFTSSTFLALGLVAVSFISTAEAATTIYFYPSETGQPEQQQTHHRRQIASETETADFFPKIAGGEPVPSNQLNYVAFIQAVRNSLGTTCTGSLVAPNVVLTAAHCLYQNSTLLYSANEFQVGFTHTTPDTGKKYSGYSVSKIFYLSSFNMLTLNSDIAVLVLATSVPASVATPILLYAGDVKQNMPVLAAGFGLTNATNANSIPTSLMEVSLALGSNAFCGSQSSTFDPNLQVCTDGTAGKDTCRGDSGGPLITPVDNGSYALLGLTSYTPINANNPNGLCAQKGGTGVYTRIGPYINWIAHNLYLKLYHYQYYFHDFYFWINFFMAEQRFFIIWGQHKH
ncbi:hypothetical protein GGI21_000908 [Coemansia aciculifera]|nr:hypothetical protein GGI21_000908 [Coemansia aciculifera]